MFNTAINLRTSSRTHNEFGIQFPRKRLPNLPTRQDYLINTMTYGTLWSRYQWSIKRIIALLAVTSYYTKESVPCQIVNPNIINNSGEMDFWTYLSRWPSPYQLFPKGSHYHQWIQEEKTLSYRFWTTAKKNWKKELCNPTIIKTYNPSWKRFTKLPIDVVNLMANIIWHSVSNKIPGSCAKRGITNLSWWV